jgi:hypothetical protein
VSPAGGFEEDFVFSCGKLLIILSRGDLEAVLRYACRRCRNACGVLIRDGEGKNTHGSEKGRR